MKKISNMKKISKLMILTALLLSACATPTTATPNAGEVALTMLADKVQSEATQAAVNSRFTATQQIMDATSTQAMIIVQATGTQQARVDMQSTADQERADAQATSAQGRKDAQATQARIDAEATASQGRIDAQSTADQSRRDAESTAVAGATSTSWVVTQTAIPPAATMTQIANEQEILLRNNAVEKSNLEVEQQRQKNTVDWALPAIIILMAAIAGAVFVIRKSRWNVIKSDDGDVEAIGFDETLIQPKLLPGPMLDLKAKLMPQLTDSGNQAEIVKREQQIRALGNMPVNPTGSGVQAFNSFFGGEQKPRFEMLNEDDTPPAGLVDPETLKVIDGDWKDANEQ